MAFIAHAGNLTSPPMLRTSPTTGEVYTYAQVATADARTNPTTGEVTKGPRIIYNVYVKGPQAERLVECATECGNIPVVFVGTLRVSTYTTRSGQERLSYDVYAKHVGVEFSVPITAKLKPKTHATARHAPTSDEPTPGPIDWQEAPPASPLPTNPT